MDNLKKKQDLNKEEQLLDGSDSGTTSEDATTSPNKKRLGLINGGRNATDGGSVKVDK